MMVENLSEKLSSLETVNPQKQLSKKSLNPILEGVRQIMPGLAGSLGDDYELVLHDFKDIRHSLTSIEGNVTDRSPGSPLTDLILQFIRKDEKPKDLLNYPSHTHDGRMMRSSTIFIRDLDGKVIGCLCINRDLTNWNMVRSLLKDLCETTSLDTIINEPGDETFVQEVEELLLGTINEVLAMEKKLNKFMDKTDKIHVVKELDARGIFLIRGSVKTVARALNVSRYTIYNYLDVSRRKFSTPVSLE